MLLLLPILVPLIGGIFVFRQKNETYRDWLVVTLIVITAVMVLANCTMPTQRLWLLTIQGDLGLVLNSDWLSKFFMVLAVCIWAPVVVFTKPYIRHAGQGNQFMGFYTMTLGVLMGLAQAAQLRDHVYVLRDDVPDYGAAGAAQCHASGPPGQASNTWGIPYSARAWPWPATSLSPIT